VSVQPPDFVSLPEPFARWFASRGWAPREHQLALLEKARAGRSALLIAPTGAGKTLAGFLPTLVELRERTRAPAGRALSLRSPGLHTLYLSPLKALAVDVARNLDQPVADKTADQVTGYLQIGSSPCDLFENEGFFISDLDIHWMFGGAVSLRRLAPVAKLLKVGCLVFCRRN